MTFEIGPEVDVAKDGDGQVRMLSHSSSPYTTRMARLKSPTPPRLAAKYVREVAQTYGLDRQMLTKLSRKLRSGVSQEGSLLQLDSERRGRDTIVVSFGQTYRGIPVWRAGLVVYLTARPLQVVGSECTVRHDVKVRIPGSRAPYLPERLDAKRLAAALRLPKRGKRPSIHSAERLVYRYDAKRRLHPDCRKPNARGFDESGPPTLKLKRVSKTLTDGKYYVVSDVLFALEIADEGVLNWHALVEPRTGDVLYLRALVADQRGSIFPLDPISQTGDANMTPSASPSKLDRLRLPVDLERLDPVDPDDQQHLAGEYVELMDTDDPTVAAPTEPSPYSFVYHCNTDDFAAVNAYYHVDGAFQMVADMGFNIATYFAGTRFPIPVDHRGMKGKRNARCAGNAANNGVEKFLFGLADAAQDVGIAADRRVVLHEFGHALLWNQVHDANMDFVHTVGDSLAVIAADPDSWAPDRGLSFPFPSPNIDRRHDRDVVDWAWGGDNDDQGYLSEEILSTTLYRLYQSIGGADRNRDIQRWASRYVTFLIIEAVERLTPRNNPNHCQQFAQHLMDADRNLVDFEGHPGGAVHKVIRWSFEQQGAYQPPTVNPPFNAPGAPPPVDLFIDDGRDGGYEYEVTFDNSRAIWSRLAPDGGIEHQAPDALGVNYLYVRVGNRGDRHANNVVVRAFQGRPGTSLNWPDDWAPTRTRRIEVAGGIGPGAEVAVGPFEWQPEEEGHATLLVSASADEDLSNIERVRGPLPHWRLVPFDNNIAQRNVTPREYRPNIRLTPTRHHFGNLCTGKTLTAEVRISNVGMQPLSVSNIMVTNSDHFSIDRRFGETPCRTSTPVVAPLGSCTIGVRYTPASMGHHTTYLLVHSDDPDLPVARASLTGTSLANYAPRVRVLPQSIDFGEVRVGSSSKPRFVSFDNIGTKSLRLLVYPMKGAHWTTNFSAGLAPCGSAQCSVAACEYCTIALNFKPRSRGRKRDELLVSTNDPSNRLVKVIVRGTGV